MDEITIDEMIAFLRNSQKDAFANPPPGFKPEFLALASEELARMINAICAILENIRDGDGDMWIRNEWNEPVE